MEAATVIQALAVTPFTAGLAPSERRRLAELGTLRLAGPGEVILREGEETREFGIVRSGRLALRLLVPGRGAITILTVEPGDLFGWSAIVPPYRSTSTVVSVGQTESIVFEASALREALARDDDLAIALYPRLLRTIARRLEATRGQLLDLFGTGSEQAW
jgi:CRP/FNR family cyclic AMP-dependent transcriptional regulator